MLLDEHPAAITSLTVSEKKRIKPSRRHHKENQKDCRTKVQQLNSSSPRSVLMRLWTARSRLEKLYARRTLKEAYMQMDKTRWTKLCPGSLDG